MKLFPISISGFIDYLRVRREYFKIHYDEKKVPVYTLPDPLKLLSGGMVVNPDEWKEKRRPEILNLFQEFVYGRSPEDCHVNQSYQISCDERALSGLATRKEITIFFNGHPEGPCIHTLVYLPNHASKPVPAFLGLNFQGNHTIQPDPGISLTRQWKQKDQNASLSYILPSEKTRGKMAKRWPVEKIMKSGYALATAYYGDMEPDVPGGHRYGIRSIFKNGPQSEKKVYLPGPTDTSPAVSKENMDAPVSDAVNDWGAIGAWAWGLSRIMDYLQSDTDIRSYQVALFGHSRLGKTALWAGAVDERFAMVISNNSGCGGAALSRRCFGETIQLLNVVRPHWFSKKLKRFNGKENELPVDQHMLIALMAPRPVYVASAEKDISADPKGEFLSAKHAEPVYNLMGMKGLGTDQAPVLNKPVGGTIGYHIRSGEHDVTDFDWEQFLCFANRKFRAKDIEY